jgi:PAS domain S-box-containing protein
MTIRRFLQIISFSLLFLIIALPILVVLLFINQRSLYECQKHHLHSRQLASEIRQNSDDLTRFARTYVVTGDGKYERYYHDIQAIRNGEKPRPDQYDAIYWDFIAAGQSAPATLVKPVAFRDLLKSAGLTGLEMANLKEALDNSDALAKTEEIAMNASQGRYDDGKGHFTKAGPPDKELAMRLLVDEAYYRGKAQIMKPLNEFLVKLDAGTASKIEEYTRRGKIYMTLTLCIQAVLLGLIMFSFTTIEKILFAPIASLDNHMKSVAADLGRLAKIAEDTAGGNLSQAFSAITKPIKQHSADEIGALTKTHDFMLARLQETGESIARITADLTASNKAHEAKNELLQKEMEERAHVEASLRESEERNRFFSELAFEGIIIHREGMILDTNETFLYMFGFSNLEETSDTNYIRDLVVPDYQDIVKQHVAASSSETYNARFQRKDGVSFWGETRGFTIDYKGKPTRVAIINNITPQVQAQEALRESEKKFRTISLAALDAIIMVDNNGDVIYWNPAAERIFGHSEKEIIGENLHSILVPPEHQEAYQEAFPHWQKTGEGNAVGKTMELTALRKDGSKIPVELSLSSVLLGNQWNAISLARDISERKNFEKELLEARERADRANQAKSEFLANMSHEIRTPMNAIIGFSELLKGRMTDEKSREYLQGILAGGKNLLGLIEDILDLSKIEAGRMEIRWEPSDPYSLCEDMTQIFAVRTAEKGIELRSEISPELPRGLMIDEIRVRQILLNLIGNAVKFTEKGAVTLRVLTESPDTDRSAIDLIFEVQDTGIGIPENQQEMIFEAFRQQEGQSTRKFGGTGLGLTITKRLVEMMGGRISVRSEAGKGSTFRVYIPGVKLTAIAPSSMEDRNEFENFLFNGAVVLLAEDIESNRQVIAGLLEPHDIILLTAANGLEAVETARRIPPDLILMDLQMPVMDGYEATRILKEDTDLRGIPIVAITASSTDSDMQKARQLLDGYLRKPVTKRSLLNELAHYLPHSFPDDRTPAAQRETEEPAMPFGEEEIPEEIRQILIAEFKSRWEDVSSGMVVEEIKSFAGDLKALGVSRDIFALREFGETLHQQASSFKIDRMISTLERFPHLLEMKRDKEYEA